MDVHTKKLAVIVLGKRNAGKSSTWYKVFGRKIRSGWKKVELNTRTVSVFVQNASHEERGTQVCEDVFVRNSSFEETDDEPETYFRNRGLPLIVFCSVQYVEEGLETMDWFRQKGYTLYIQWLNPGYWDQHEYADFLNIREKFGDEVILTRNSKYLDVRASEIKNFVSGWINGI
jgi:hypothetical protein